MNPELEGLVLALDAVLEARNGEEADRWEAAYQARLDLVLRRCPHLSRDTLAKLIDVAYRRWCRAQRRPASVPPEA